MNLDLQLQSFLQFLTVAAILVASYVKVIERLKAVEIELQNLKKQLGIG
jgi:hypothetical protein